MQVSWVDLNSTAASIKALCPEPFLFYNEGGAPLWGNYNINHEHTECEPSPTPTPHKGRAHPYPAQPQLRSC